MTFRGYTNTSPVDPDQSGLEASINTRLTVNGEARVRRGLARSSLAKTSGSVLGISEFALSPVSPYAVTLGSGSIDGEAGLSSLWGDATLTPLSGTHAPLVGTSFTVTVNRSNSTFATSAIIFAKLTYPPTDSDLGTYVGEVALDPWSSSATTAWTAPSSGAWKFRVYPVRNRIVGPGANTTSAAYSAVTNGYVYGSTVISGTAYISGTFTSVTGANGTFTRSRVAAIDLSTGNITSWNPNANAVVRTLANDGTNIYLGGDFATIGGISAPYAACVDASGALTGWSVTLNGLVTSMSMSGSILYMGGNFTTANGFSRPSMCAVDTASSLQSISLSLTTGLNKVLVRSGKLYIGCGTVETIGGKSGSLFSLDATSGGVSGGFTPPSASGGSGQVYALAVDGSGNIYFGGDFTSIGATGRNYAAAVDSTGSLLSWNPNLNGIVQSSSMTMDAAGRIYFGGAFTTVGGVSRPYAAATTSGGALISWPSTTPSGQVIGLTDFSAQSVIIGSSSGERFVYEEAP